MKTVNCWIVCRECDDPYYEGHPTGVVFLSEARAKEYLADYVADGCETLYIEKGYVMDTNETKESTK